MVADQVVVVMVLKEAPEAVVLEVQPAVAIRTHLELQVAVVTEATVVTVVLAQAPLEEQVVLGPALSAFPDFSPPPLRLPRALADEPPRFPPGQFAAGAPSGSAARPSLRARRPRWLPGPCDGAPRRNDAVAPARRPSRDPSVHFGFFR